VFFLGKYKPEDFWSYILPSIVLSTFQTIRIFLRECTLFNFQICHVNIFRTLLLVPPKVLPLRAKRFRIILSSMRIRRFWLSVNRAQSEKNRVAFSAPPISGAPNGETIIFPVVYIFRGVRNFRFPRLNFTVRCVRPDCDIVYYYILYSGDRCPAYVIQEYWRVQQQQYNNNYLTAEAILWLSWKRRITRMCVYSLPQLLNAPRTARECDSCRRAVSPRTVDLRCCWYAYILFVLYWGGLNNFSVSLVLQPVVHPQRASYVIQFERTAYREC